MREITLKTGNRKTTIPRAIVRWVVAEVYRQKAIEDAAKKKLRKINAAKTSGKRKRSKKSS